MHMSLGGVKKWTPGLDILTSTQYYRLLNEHLKKALDEKCHNVELIMVRCSLGLISVAFIPLFDLTGSPRSTVVGVQ